jgi:hypothetical protein
VLYKQSESVDKALENAVTEEKLLENRLVVTG